MTQNTETIEDDTYKSWPQKTLKAFVHQKYTEWDDSQWRYNSYENLYTM